MDTEPRADRQTLEALGFSPEELQELRLWEPPTGAPNDLADVYLRRSKKSDTLSVLREQLRRMVRRVHDHNRQVRHVWFEQRSASKAYVKREEFDKANAAVLSDRASTALYVYKVSRLSRRGAGQVGLLLDSYDEAGAYIYVVSEGLDSRSSRMILTMLSEQAREQVRDLTDFVEIGIAAAKAEGRWTGGVTPYGLRCEPGSGKLSHDPAEYPTARRIAEYLVANRTPGWVKDKLNSEGLTSRSGKPWSTTGIIALAHSVSWAGLVPKRERALINGKYVGKYHRGGEPLIGPDGMPVRCGEGVITPAERQKILANLASRSRPGSPIGDRSRGKRETKALLLGWGTCGRCKGPYRNDGPHYRCRNRKELGATVCIGSSANRQAADDAMAVLWINHITSLPPDSPVILAIAREWLSYQNPEASARRADVQAALESAVRRELTLGKERFVIGRMPESVYETLYAELTAQIESLKRELAELDTEPDLTPLMDPLSVIDLWNDQDVAGKRALIGAALESVEFRPSKGRGYREPMLDRMTPHWKHRGGAAQ